MMGLDGHGWWASVGIVFVLLTVGASVLYFVLAGAISLASGGAGVIRRAVWLSLANISGQALITSPIVVLLVRGHGRLYYDVAEHGWAYLAASAVGLLAFTETLVYWIHRGLHHPWLYKHIHIFHHEFRDPNPWVSMAFHPLDAFAQAAPYYLFAFLVPLHVGVFIPALVFINLWTYLIHTELTAGRSGAVLNFASHHEVHHSCNKFNYGQFLTIWDRLGGTHRDPVPARTRVSKADAA